MRDIIIGDVHGCSGALQALLDIIKPDPACDRLILLGDLFDRGPNSWEVFQKVKELEAAFGRRFVLIRGNHEDYLLSGKMSFSQRMMWKRVGMNATVRSFKQHGEKMEDAAPWIKEHCVLYYKGTGFQCVHAGLADQPPEESDIWTLCHNHSIVLENLYDGPLTVTGHIALSAPTWFAGDDKTVEIVEPGKWLPLPKRGIICIDAGCGKGGMLIGMVVENDQFFLYGTHQGN